MANEISLTFGSLALSNTNNITISNISVKENKNVQTSKIPVTDGSIAETARRVFLTITVEGDIAGSGYDDLRTNLDALRAGLQNGIQEFTTDDDRYIKAQMKDFDYTITTMRILATWRATFVAHYPFWLSEASHEDERVPVSGVGYTINNAGNAPARAKIEITAPGGDITDNCKIENSTTNQSFQYRGTIEEYTDLEVDNRYDTDDFEVLNDGVDNHTNFEGDFITLNPGDNTIVFTGTANAIVKITHRDCWY
jgi:hypothetical protein